MSFERSLSVLALLVMASFFSSMSHQAETDRMAAGIATPLLRNSMARLTARLPPIDWPVRRCFQRESLSQGASDMPFPCPQFGLGTCVLANAGNPARVHARQQPWRYGQQPFDPRA